MKVFKHIILSINLVVFCITVNAQCPSINNLNVILGTNGTATVTPVFTNSTLIAPTSNLYWYSYPNATQTSGLGTFQFPANGTYSVCLNYIDSLNSCWSSLCATVAISNMTAPICNAAFTAYTDSNCVTHFVNSTIGSNLTYQWYDMSNSFSLFSTQSNPTFTFANGTYLIGLYSFSNGSFCDSTTQVITVNCNNSGTNTACQASFYTYTDSFCVTHFINTSNAVNLGSSWIVNNIYYPSSGSNLSLAIGNGTYSVGLYSYSNGVFCDSTNQVITVNCNASGTNTACQASFYAYTDSACITHFVNTSIGINLTSSWTINNMCYPPSGSNLSLSLGNGSYPVLLQTYSNGVLCDSSYQTININCISGGTTTPSGCQANSQFYVFADSTNAGNYFAYNISSGTGNLSYLWNFGDGTTSTQQYPFHQYAIPGNYVICLTVTATYSTALGGNSSCTDTYCDSSSVQKMIAGFVMNQINVIPQSSTSINQSGSVIRFNVYPNPMANELTIEVLDKANLLSYNLLDALGRVVLKGNIETSSLNINTNSLAKGFYSLNITNTNGNSLKTIKLVK